MPALVSPVIHSVCHAYLAKLICTGVIKRADGNTCLDRIEQCAFSQWKLACLIDFIIFSFHSAVYFASVVCM